MIILENEKKQGTLIIVKDGKCEIKRESEVNEAIDGIGILAEDGQLLGVYCKEEELFFAYGDKNVKVNINTFQMENNYVSKTERLFEVYDGEEVICAIRYAPYISPLRLGFLTDEDEFDELLRLSNTFSDSNKTANYIEYVKRMKKEMKRGGDNESNKHY